MAAAQAAQRAAARDDDRVVWARAATLLTGAVLAWAVFSAAAWSPWWLAVPAIVFVGLIRWHDRVDARAARAARLVEYYQRAQARLRGEWIGTGATGEAYVPEGHVYAADLDCVGRGSVFELLCSARTQAGERVLAAWLLSPATRDEILARQQAAAELRAHVDLREALALAGDELRAAVDTSWLVRWGSQADAAPSALLRAVPVAVVVLLFAALVISPTPAVLAPILLLHIGTSITLHRRTGHLIATIERPARDLRTLADVLAVIEQASFKAPRLQALAAALVVDGRPPSAQIKHLGRLVDLLDARRNQLFIPFALVLLWTQQLGLALAAWRARCGGAIDRWVMAVGELEALLSLARHAYEHPSDPFPEIVDAGPLFDGVAVAHPLLPVSQAVPNDLSLDATRQSLVVSGSNMSGKSTMLRTVGTNVVLALAGGTVRAERLRLSPLTIGASIRVTDSLLDGHSRFYAEILRLRDVVARASTSPPTLFLLDEILHGTNSHDRCIGAEAVVRSLLKRGAIGLVTTHDLALATVADALAPAVGNVHFADELDEGSLRFDYRMRPGVVTHSNALALMRAVGLDV